jgi:hypothetical protein
MILALAAAGGFAGGLHGGKEEGDKDADDGDDDQQLHQRKCAAPAEWTIRSHKLDSRQKNRGCTQRAAQRLAVAGESER